MTQQIESKICYLYVLNTLADWEVGFITAELKSKRYLSKNIKYDLIIVGNSIESIETMGGILITPEKSIEDIEFKEGDLIILPGADTWMAEKNKKILEMLPNLLQKRVIVAVICGATVALAQNGLLNDRAHTSNDNDFLKMFCPDYTGSSYYISTPVVVDDNLITASGLAPLEFSYEVFKKMDVMKEETLESWYQLFKTRESKYFYKLMDSIK